jgi:two-component system cell cycle response regulator
MRFKMTGEFNHMNHKPKVLIVDDEPLNVKLLAGVLSSEQFETIPAYNGDEALQKVEAESPDLILLDIMMPGINGYEVIRRLRSDSENRDIPVILVTALDGTDNKIMGLEAGADEFINKPVNQAELLARVKSLIRLKQYQDQLKAQTHSINSFTPETKEKKSSQKEINLPSILLVEEDERDAKLIQTYLYGEPCRIKLARSGEEAISCARQERIDVILLDILLPGMDGFEVCRILKETEQTRNIQIIAVTSLLDLDSKVRGIELGADDYLVKPINMHELRTRVKALIKKKAYLDSLCCRYEVAVYAAITDKLTGLYNHGYFEHFFDLEIKRALRQETPVALLMIDVDDFKQYNDKLGHLAGDEILRELGKFFKTNIREIDLAARYGGEEFAVVLSNVGKKGAVKTAERIRQAILGHSFVRETSCSVKKLSVSIGVAVYPGDADDARGLTEKADRALYTAKREGKNRVCCL